MYNDNGLDSLRELLDAAYEWMADNFADNVQGSWYREIRAAKELTSFDDFDIDDISLVMETFLKEIDGNGMYRASAKLYRKIWNDICCFCDE